MAIWEAATDLFAEKGFDETTVDEIADKAGISRRSFFRYFSSKSDLMASATVEYGALLAGAIESCPPGSPVAEVVREAVGKVARECTAQPRTRKVMQILSKYPAAREALHSRAPELRDRVEAAFHSRGGALCDLNAVLLTELTLAVLDTIFHAWFRAGEEDIQTTADRVFATLGQMVPRER